ncbi:helix-turn-helix transcriptional regulator [Microbispora sp. NPDC046973]|uniref:helix-turn-helix domain-containing protein n=1 Tax=Microbispora sp. NPDC046973 TaxID=3155022 RepID=UPI0033FAA6F8
MQEREHRSLGALIRAWRNRALLTQEQLADRAGVNVRTIGRLEGDAVGRPRSASLQRLAEALGLDGRERAALAAAACRTPARRGAEDAWPGIPRRGAPELLIVLADAAVVRVESACRCRSRRDARR